ncbi:MAG: hypothetical protein ACR2RF_25895 [Geminicoccaceae bacterium]
MNTFNASMVATLVTLSLDACWHSEAEATMAKTYHMIVSGDAGARFSGQCNVKTSGGETVLTLNGQVPHEQEVVGHGLSCQLQADGRIVIDIEHDGSRTRSATNGGRINISLR